MRKFITISLFAAVMLTASAAVIFAQSNGNSTPAPTTTAAWLGVGVAENNNQVVVARIEAGSPANAAGLLIGDVITSFNGTAITSASDLRTQVQAAAPGASVTLVVLRNGQSVNVSVTLGTLPSAIQGFTPRSADALDMLFNAERLVHADLSATTGGYQVVRVVSDTNPFTLQVGDLLTTLNGQDLTQLDLQTLRSAMQGANGTLTLVVTRGGQSVTLTASLTDGLGFGPGFGGDDGGPGDMGGRGGRGGMGNMGGQGNQGNQQSNPGQNANPPANGGAGV